ncbi:MAG: hypothetical protein QXU20_03750 [Candidatus Woesearchaeota archaeon]
MFFSRKKKRIEEQEEKELPMLAKDVLEKTRTIETIQPIEIKEQKKDNKEKKRFLFFKAREEKKDKDKEEIKQSKEKEKFEIKNFKEEPKKEEKRLETENIPVQSIKKSLKEQADLDFEDLISTNKGFFAKLLEEIYEKSFEELAKKDLIEEIKNYFATEKNKKEIEYEKKAAYFRLKNLLLELSKLEKDWEEKNIIIEQYKEQIRTTEERIRELSEIIRKEAQKLNLEEEIPSEKEFILNDGRRLKNLRELLEALKTMDNNLFNHHVSPERNDFANWIKDVFKKEFLAEKVLNAKTREEIIKVLSEELE